MLYFAYGSNLLEREICRDAPSARAVGVGFLKGYRLVFTKHSERRRCDAASLQSRADGIVRGCLYQLSEADCKGLKKREKGYSELTITVGQVAEAQPDGMPVEAFTFIGEKVCSRSCGPSAEYLGLILEGARSRRLPPEYITSIELLARHTGTDQSDISQNQVGP